MMQIAYLSFATRQFKADANKNIEEILREARLHNNEHGITGQLIYRSGIFVQLLEGEQHIVEHLMGRILLDYKRHENLRVLLRQEVSKRIFPEWSMAYKKLEDASMDLVNSIIPWQRLIRASDADGRVPEDKILHLFEELGA